MAVVNHMGWSQVIFMGHSASGRVVVSAAANFPGQTAKLMVLDSPLGGEFGDPNRPEDRQSADHVRIGRGHDGGIRQGQQPAAGGEATASARSMR